MQTPTLSRSKKIHTLRMIETIEDALDVLKRAWPMISDECRAVLGGELHFQAILYHCLRSCGVPRTQLGMNVKQWITDPVSPVFQALDLKKHEDFRGGFEPIPDLVIFSPAIGADWRRRNRETTLLSMLLAVEVKASERHEGRLTRAEIVSSLPTKSCHFLHGIGQASAGMMAYSVMLDAAAMTARPVRVR